MPVCSTKSEPPTYPIRFRNRLQNTEWVRGSRPRSPKSNCGFSAAMPKSPSFAKVIGNMPERISPGTESVNNHTAKPKVMPMKAPSLVARFQ